MSGHWTAFGCCTSKRLARPIPMSAMRRPAFYTAMGFVPVEERHDLWPDNPWLIMAKSLDRQ